MRRLLKRLFNSAWRLTSGMALLDSTMGRGFGRDAKSNAEIGAERAATARRIAEVGAAPKVDRYLTRAAIDPRDGPPGMTETGREWVHAGSAIAALRQGLEVRSGRLGRSGPTRLLTLELRRYRSVEEASAASAEAPQREMPDGSRMRSHGQRNGLWRWSWERHAEGLAVESVIELRVAQATAVAILTAIAERPDHDWEPTAISLIRGVERRLS